MATATAISFAEFQGQVEKFWPGASKEGRFRDYNVSQAYGPRVYYEWHHQHFGAVSYDTAKDNPWYVNNGRGSGACGDTIETANKLERERYDSFIRSRD
jgi:hypothetical protein